MKAIYEHIRENFDGIYVAKRCTIISAHFHNSLEVHLVRCGRYAVTLNGAQYEVCDGGIFVSDSYDVHSYDKCLADNCDDYVVIIPCEYMSRFNAHRNDRRILHPVVHNKQLCDSLCSIVENIFLTAKGEVLRAGVELFLALIGENFEFSDATVCDGQLIRSILDYIQKNYRGEVSCSLIAKKLGYTESHVSRTFHKYLKSGLPEYVNGLRLDYVQRELDKNDGRKITELIFEAGFNSMQSYYRNKANQELR